MNPYPAFGSPRELTAYLLSQRRLAEIPFSELSPDDLHALTAMLHRQLLRARLRAFVAHASGAVLTLGFLVMGAVLFGVGPMVHVNSFPEMSDLTVPTEGALWLLLLVTTTFGLAAADYLWRRRRRIMHSRDREVSAIRHALERAAERAVERA